MAREQAVPGNPWGGGQGQAMTSRYSRGDFRLPISRSSMPAACPARG